MLTGRSLHDILAAALGDQERVAAVLRRVQPHLPADRDAPLGAGDVALVAIGCIALPAPDEDPMQRLAKFSDGQQTLGQYLVTAIERARCALPDSTTPVWLRYRCSTTGHEFAAVDFCAAASCFFGPAERPVASQGALSITAEAVIPWLLVQHLAEMIRADAHPSAGSVAIANHSASVAGGMN